MSEVLRLVGQPVAVRVSLSLLHFLWQGAALAAVAAGLLVALRKASAGARYLALVALLAAMAVCPVVTFALMGRAPVAVRPPVLGGVGLSRPPGSDNLRSPQQGRAVLLGRSLLARQSLGDGGPRAPAISEPARESRATWPARAWLWARRALLPVLPWVSVLWVSGVIVLSLRFLMRGWALWRVSRSLQLAGREWQERLGQLSRRLALSRPVELAVSAAARVPMVIRWLRPAIVIPASALIGLTPEQLTALLAHELAHIRRHDQWVNLAQTLIELLLFYHPAVWWVSRAIRAEREHCCDEIAVAVSGDATAYMRALTWVEQHRGATVEPALASSGPPLLGRIRRLAGCPTTLERRNTWLAAVLALTVAGAISVAAAVSAATTGSMSGEHQLGVREQWQPQTMPADPRLDKPVHIEILGRAAVPALALLSEQTGVTLQVAPEDTETVGERKFTVIAQGCSLKAIMVQLPKALQECHWDIDLTGKEPVYLLHRNGGMDTTMAQLAAEEDTRWQEERRPARGQRLAEARKALAMSPEELDELIKTDPLLAATVKDPEARTRLQLLLNLPANDMEDFITTGRAYMPYPAAPEAYQQAARQRVNSFVKESGSSESVEIRVWTKIVLDMLPQAAIYYEDYGDDGVGSGIQCFDTRGAAGRRGDFLRLGMSGIRALPPRLLTDDLRAKWYRDLLVSTGLEEQAADHVLQGLVTQFREQQREKQERKRKLEWREPRSPQLHKVVTLPFKDNVGNVEMQQFIAKETGLSLVSDYFTTWGPREIPQEAKAPLPVWRLLYSLGDSWFWSYDWNEAGDCIVFHDRNWYVLAPQEFPESMVAAYREKLKQQGRFTLDDVAAAAVELARRRPVPPRQRGKWPWSDVNVPSDLGEAGLSGDSLRSEAVLLYATLTPEQRGKARSGEGLPYTKMTGKEQELVRPYAFFEGGWHHDKHSIPEEEISRAVYRIKQSRQEGRTGPGELVQLQVEFPSLEAGTGLWLRLPKPAAAGSQ